MRLRLQTPERITIHGNLEIFSQPFNSILALFCSQQAPASVLLTLQDLAHHWREHGPTIISGFHSPSEQEVFNVLLRGPTPIIHCLARGIETMRLKPEWKKPVEEGRLLLMSPFNDSVKRPTAETAIYRNQFVSALAGEVLIAHAAPRSKTEALAKELMGLGKPIYTLDHPTNKNLQDLGVLPYKE